MKVARDTPKLNPSHVEGPGQILNTSEKHENHNDEESETHAPCWDIAPLAAVRPPRQRTEECQDQKDDQYSCKHCFLFSLRIQAWISRYPTQPRSGCLTNFRAGTRGCIWVTVLKERLVHVDGDCDSISGIPTVVHVIAVSGVVDIHIIGVVPIV
jgi:hypothetical protein